jgi:hypothetical protein
MRGFIKPIGIVTAALAIAVVPTVGASAMTANPTYHCMDDCNGNGNSEWQQQSYGQNTNDDSSARHHRRNNLHRRYYIPGGGSYTGGRCDAPYGPSGPKPGCPWN